MIYSVTFRYIPLLILHCKTSIFMNLFVSIRQCFQLFICLYINQNIYTSSVYISRAALSFHLLLPLFVARLLGHLTVSVVKIVCTLVKDKDKDPFIGPQEFVVEYSKAPYQPQRNDWLLCQSHTMTTMAPNQPHFN